LFTFLLFSKKQGIRKIGMGSGDPRPLSLDRTRGEKGQHNHVQKACRPTTGRVHARPGPILLRIRFEGRSRVVRLRCEKKTGRPGDPCFVLNLRGERDCCLESLPGERGGRRVSPRWTAISLPPQGGGRIPGPFQNVHPWGGMKWNTFRSVEGMFWAPREQRPVGGGGGGDPLLIIIVLWAGGIGHDHLKTRGPSGPSLSRSPRSGPKNFGRWNRVVSGEASPPFPIAEGASPQRRALEGMPCVFSLGTEGWRPGDPPRGNLGSDFQTRPKAFFCSRDKTPTGFFLVGGKGYPIIPREEIGVFPSRPGAIGRGKNPLPSPGAGGRASPGGPSRGTRFLNGNGLKGGQMTRPPKGPPGDGVGGRLKSQRSKQRTCPEGSKR